jgi:hypothetical protein
MVMLHPAPGARRTSEVPPRAVVLREMAVGAARSWTKRWLSTLEADGRAVEGGFPGTVSEARAVLAHFAGRALVDLGAPALAREELPELTRITYDEARRSWRGSAR